MEAGAIILSGGKSSRMGTNKALLKINQVTNIERIAGSLKPVFQEQIIVTNDPEAYRFLGLKTVVDHFPGKGPLAGLHAGLLASAFDVNVIVACDMPFVTKELASALLNHARHYDAVVPVIGGNQHPLFSVFKKNAVPKIEDSLKNDRLRMKHLLDHLNVLYVTEEDLKVAGSLEHIFFNMNNPHEYEDAKKWAEEESHKRGW